MNKLGLLALSLGMIASAAIAPADAQSAATGLLSAQFAAPFPLPFLRLLRLFAATHLWISNSNRFLPAATGSLRSISGRP